MVALADMNEQNASGVGGASTGTDFQPPTQNPQGNVNSTLQTTGSGLQSAGGAVLGEHTSILVPTATGTVAVSSGAPAVAAQPVAVKHTNLALWLGAGLVLLMLAVMSFNLLRPRKYS